jgi:hypothetical protein
MAIEILQLLGAEYGARPTAGSHRVFMEENKVE